MRLLNDGIRYSSAISAATFALVSRQARNWQMSPALAVPPAPMVQSPPQIVPSQQRIAPPHKMRVLH